MWYSYVYWAYFCTQPYLSGSYSKTVTVKCDWFSLCWWPSERRAQTILVQPITKLSGNFFSTKFYVLKTRPHLYNERFRLLKSSALNRQQIKPLPLGDNWSHEQKTSTKIFFTCQVYFWIFKQLNWICKYSKPKTLKPLRSSGMTCIKRNKNDIHMKVLKSDKTYQQTSILIYLYGIYRFVHSFLQIYYTCKSTVCSEKEPSRTMTINA